MYMSKCAVQAESTCVNGNLDNLMKELESARAGNVPETQEVPGVYYSTGKTICQDLNHKNDEFAIPVLSG
jgi:hypothetical protein